MDQPPTITEKPSPRLRKERRSWYFYDWATSVFSTTVITVFLAPYLTGIAENAADSAGYIHPLGIPVVPGAFFGYVLSVSTVIQVIVLPIVGGIADHSQRKKLMLGILSYTGALCTAALFFVQGSNYVLGAGLFVLANVAYGSSIVVYYSWLPELAGPNERDEVSSRGWAFGYLGSGLLLALNLVLFLNAEPLGLTDGEAVRICLASAGVWWAIFTIIPIVGLRAHQRAEGHEHGIGVLTGGFRQLRTTFKDMRNYPKTLFFLGAFLLYNDGIQTVANIAGQYGDRELGLERSTLITAILLVQFIAFAGALLMGLVARRLGALKTVQWSLVLWIGVLIGAYFLGKNQAVQFFIAAIFIGFVLGGSQALSRSLFSQMIPHGKEAEYFSFYEISERGTSWLGPLLYGVIYQITGSYRYAVIALVIFFILGLALLSRFDARAAILEAGNTPPTVV